MGRAARLRIHISNNRTASSSTVVMSSGGIWPKPRCDKRWNITERSGWPGAMMRASGKSNVSCCGRARIFDREVAVVVTGRKQHGIGLLLVPTEGVTGPFVLLEEEDAGFNPPARLRIAAFHFQGQALDEHCAFGEFPRLLLAEFNL